MQLTLTMVRGRFDERVSDMFSAMCAWVLFANLQANLSPFRCIPHYVTQRDVERNNCSLEQVAAHTYGKVTPHKGTFIEP